MTPVRRSSTFVIFLDVGRYMGRRLICEHTYAGTLEKDPSFAPGPSVGNASPDLMSCSDTREHTQVCHLQPHKQTNKQTLLLHIICQSFPTNLSHLSAIYSSVHQSIPVNHSRISPSILPYMYPFLPYMYPFLHSPFLFICTSIHHLFPSSLHLSISSISSVHPFVHQSILVIHFFHLSLSIPSICPSI